MMGVEEDVIRAEKLNKVFSIKGKKPLTALNGLSLSVKKGELTAVIGPDGAGKTTLMRLIAGLMNPTSGSLTVLGMDSVKDAEEIQSRISYMPQKFGLYEDLTVQENLDLYADLHGVPQEKRPERFGKLLDMMGLAPFTGRFAGKLSGGMKQKLGLACTLVRSPDLLLLDEPTVGVDPLSRRELWKILKTFVKEEHLSIFVSTAYMNEAEMCSHVFVLHKGNLLADGTPPDIVMFSGGVAACFGEEEDLFRYGDIGILLAQAIRKNEAFRRAAVTDARETMRATVIGAGNYSMNISGSTIEYTTKPFPLKNIPVVKLLLEREEEIEKLPENMHRALQLYREDQEKDRQVALAMKGLKCPTFAQVQRIAELIADQYVRECGMGRHLILVLEEDIGKAIGQALHHRLKEKCSVICIDGISCGSGDFIDLGEPVASGNVIPVIVKTLIFNG